MENSKGTVKSERDGRLNVLDNRLDCLCVHLSKLTSSINLKVGSILVFEPRSCENGSVGVEKAASTFSESLEEKLQRLEAVASELDRINNHLVNIIS